MYRYRPIAIGSIYMDNTNGEKHVLNDEDVIRKLAELVYRKRLAMGLVCTDENNWKRATDIFMHLKYADQDDYLWRLNDADLDNDYRKVYDECVQERLKNA